MMLEKRLCEIIDEAKQAEVDCDELVEMLRALY